MCQDSSYFIANYYPQWLVSRSHSSVSLLLSFLWILYLPSTRWQEKCIRLESQVQDNLGALKAYMIMKEGWISEELVGYFGPQNPNDAAGEPNSPLDARGSSGASTSNI